MTDVYVALALVALLALMSAWAGARVARRTPRALAVGLAALALALLLGHLLYLRDSLWLAHLLPVPGVVVLGDLTPVLAALLIGLAWPLLPGRPARKALLAGPLALICAGHAYYPLLGGPPAALADHWRGTVCRQTTAASCGPAAAATLLADFDVRTSEREMAALCLTTDQGTSLRGLYRGLKLKADAADLEVLPFRGTIDDLSPAAPLVISVRLERGVRVDPRFERDWGWAPGVTHSVVVFGLRPDGRYDVGDPAVGREVWDRPALEALWHGEGIRVRRKP